MGNQMLSECRNGTGQNDKDILSPNIENKKSQFEYQRIIKSKNNIDPNLLYLLPQRSVKNQQIYQRLKKQKKIAYSIENQQFLQFYGHKNLKQYFQKQKKEQNDEPFKSNKIKNILNLSLQSNDLRKKISNSPESQAFTQISNDKRIQLQLKIVQFTLKKQTNHQDSKSYESHFNSRKNRSYSLSSESIDNQNSINPTEQQLLQFNQETINIFYKRYIYVGFLNQRHRPHGPGQLFYIQKEYHQSIECTEEQKCQQMNKIFIEAEFIDGFIACKDCLIIFNDEHFYRGGFNQNCFNEKGTFKLFNGLQLTGNFVQGLLEGKGKASYPDGGHYQGFFKKGLKSGKGKMAWKSKSYPQQALGSSLQITYEGYFNNDKMNGLGCLRTPNYEYWGPFLNNMKQGKGTIKFKDGKKFQGWFQKDQINGYGQLHHPDGKLEKGIFPFAKQ